jgi:hypothetical protein
VLASDWLGVVAMFLCPSALLLVLMCLDDCMVLRMAVVGRNIRASIVSEGRKGMCVATVGPDNEIPYGLWQYLELWEVAMTLAELSIVGVVSYYEFACRLSIRCLSASVTSLLQWPNGCLEGLGRFHVFTRVYFCAFDFPCRLSGPETLANRTSWPVFLSVRVPWAIGMGFRVRLEAFVSDWGGRNPCFTVEGSLPMSCNWPVEVYGVSLKDPSVSFAVRRCIQEGPRPSGGSYLGRREFGYGNIFGDGIPASDLWDHVFPFVVSLRVGVSPHHDRIVPAFR